MRNNPMVSIIIPVYNGANFLTEAIDSALAQTYKNIEIIVVNDGSNDRGKTEKVAKSYGNQIRYYKKKNGGVASALNFGIRKMRGQYFSWLSHDDAYYSNKIRAQLDYVTKINKKIIVYSDYLTIDKNSDVIQKYNLNHIPPKDFRYSLIENSFVHGCTLLVPKSLLVQIGPFSTNMITTQDYYQWFELASIAEFHHIPRILIKSRIHANQGTQIMSRQVRKDKDLLNKFFISHIHEEEILAHEDSLSDYYRQKSKEFVNKRLYGASFSALKLAIITGGVHDILMNLYQLAYSIAATLKLRVIYHE